jgi:PHD/YefM family antitoxin component YafN of YafNO toxin-antitoxin module
MLLLHPEFVVDEKARRKAVLLPLREWKGLMEAMEELEDIRAYDKAKAEADDTAPFEEAVCRVKARTKK